MIRKSANRLFANRAVAQIEATRATANRPFDIAFLSHTAMGGDLVVGSHHLARALAQRGHHVIHMSAPLSIAHLCLAASEPFIRSRIRRWARGGERFGQVLDIVPWTLVPWQVARWSPYLVNTYSRHMLMAPFAGLRNLRLEAARYLIVDEPRFVGLTKPMVGRALIYRATDLYASMRADTTIVAAERALCERADLLVATSEPVAAHLRRLSGREILVIRNGVEFEHFTSSSVPSAPDKFSLPGRPADRAIYAGAFDSRFGRDALSIAAETLPRKFFILVGPGSQELAREIHKPNVTALGPVNYEALPAVLRQCSVGLLPLSRDPSNAGRSPMKLYEYAAAGLAVAATSTEEIRLRRLSSLCLADCAAEFPAAVARAFECASNVNLIAAAKSAARQESWDIKARFLLNAVHQCAAFRSRSLPEVMSTKPPRGERETSAHSHESHGDK